MSKVISQQAEGNTIGSTGNYMIRNENPVLNRRVNLRGVLPQKLYPVKVSVMLHIDCEPCVKPLLKWNCVCFMIIMHLCKTTYSITTVTITQ